MALFGRDSDDDTQTRSPAAPARPSAPRPARRTTLIAAGARLVGEIGGDTDVMIEGTVEGKVHPSADVTVGEQGLVQGEIEARKIRVAGKVRGNVRGKESVEILASGSLEGDVASPSMVIGDGAFFKGRVEMTGQAPRGESKDEKLAVPERPKPSAAGGSTPTSAASS